LARLALAGVIVVAAACGSQSAATPDASSPGNGDGSAPAEASADAATDAPPPGTCIDASSPPTQSFSLNDWPQLTPVVATDLTAGAHVSSASVPGSPAGVLVTPDGNWVLACVSGGAGGAGQVAVLRRQGTALTLDHAIAMPANEVPFGIALSSDGKTVAVALSDEVALLDLAQTETDAGSPLVATVPTQSAKRTAIDIAFSHDGAFAFVALEYDSAVAVVDVGKRAYVGAIPIAGNAVTDVAVSPDGTRLYVTCEESQEFAQANPTPATDQIVGSITVVDAAKATTAPASAVLGHAFVGRAPVRTIVSPDGSTLWVTVRGSNAVVALDTANLLSTSCNPRLATVAVGPAPVGLTFFDGATGVAVANSNRFAQPQSNQTVSLVGVAAALAGSGSAVFGQVGVGAFPREMGADATGLFVSNYNSQSVSAIDLTGIPHP
jgi:DNA-binding beta-propeller fold protein YncE